MRSCLSGIFLILSFYLKAQVFWTEAFGGGTCSSGLSAIGFNSGNGAWAVTNTGTNNSSANAWFVSAKERGMGVGICGAGCGGTQNRTLHLGSTGFFLDLGAAYNETNANNITDKRVESPVINCTGRSSITLAFNYMEFGQGTFDNATLWYFNGTVWALLIDVPKTLCCGNVVCNGSIQGLWTAYSIALPASANNNANVRIGFRWVNNGNGVGTDPSFAVDDITLSTPVVVPIELTDLSYTGRSGNIKLQWQTATEKNSDRFDVERSSDGNAFIKMGEVKSAGESNSQKKYTFIDHEKMSGTLYYRLKMVDKDGAHAYSKLIAVDHGSLYNSPATVYYNNSDKTINIAAEYISNNGFTGLSFYNTDGKQIFKAEITGTEENYTYYLAGYSAGIYYCVLEGYESRKSHKILIQ